MGAERVDYSSDYDYEMALAQEEYENMTEEEKRQEQMDEYHSMLAESLKYEPFKPNNDSKNTDDIPF